MLTSPFLYKQNQLYCDQVALSDIAHQVGTPFYCYSADHITQRLKTLQHYLKDFSSLIAYAVKANSHLAVLKLLQQGGAGADVVSEGELIRALRAGISPEKIVFSGVGKTDDALLLALDQQILSINIESAEELQRLMTLCDQTQKRARVLLRINPDVDAGSHHKITTGRAEDKFGIPYEQAPSLYQQATNHPFINPLGLALHVGSQITEPMPYYEAFSKLADLVRLIRDQGGGISTLDLGGGMGIPYHPQDPDFPWLNYIDALNHSIRPLDCQIIIEPGRWLVAEAGVLVSRVVFHKKTPHKHFFILDAGMNDLMRPALYHAYHPIIPLLKKKDQSMITADIVGPVCETSDVFHKDYLIEALDPGNLVAILKAGAYGAVMGSCYNTRPSAPEVLVYGDHFTVIRPRQTIDHLLEQEISSILPK